MSTKVIAIGNILMGDDGIAIRILNSIRPVLDKYNIESFVAETDTDFFLSEIYEEDFIIILDAFLASENDNNTGSTVIISFEEYFNSYGKYTGITQHVLSIFQLIRINRINIKGFIIGIKIKNIEFSPRISSYLENNLDFISDNVLDIIMGLLH